MPFFSCDRSAVRHCGPQLKNRILWGQRHFDRYEQTVSQLTEALGESAYTSAHQQGADMTYDDITAYALTQLERLINAAY